MLAVVLLNQSCKKNKPGDVIVEIPAEVFLEKASAIYKSIGLHFVKPDTSTLGEASFSVSFVQKPIKGMAQCVTTAQLKGKGKRSIDKRTRARPA